MNLYEEKLERISSCLKGSIAPPFKAVLNPTNRCNLKCFFCPNALPRHKGKFKIEDEIEDKIWLDTVKEGLGIGIREWSIIGGGEPMLRCNAVISMIENIKTHRELTDCEIITNGTLFKESDIEKLVHLKMDRILFSIDAPDEKTHDYLRNVKGTFKKSTTNLKRFSIWKNRLKADKPYIKVNMVLNKKNFTKIIPMMKLMKNIGTQELAIHPMREYWDLKSQVQHLRMNDEENIEMKKEIVKAKKISEKLGIFLNTDMIQLESNEIAINDSNKTAIKEFAVTCFEPLYSLLIDPEGNAGKCSPSGFGFKELNVKDKSLEEIWYSKKLNEIRKMIIKGEEFDSCPKCGLTDLKIHLTNDLVKLGLI